MFPRVHLNQDASAPCDTRLRFALANAGHDWWTWDARRDRICPGEFWCSQAGAAARGGMTVREWIAFVHPDDRRGLIKSVARYVRGDSDAFSVTYRVGPVGGRWRRVSSVGRLNIDGQHPTLVEGVHVDIDPHEQMTRTLEQRTAEIERLISVLAHDLRGPLVTILGFLHHLDDDLTADRPVDARESLAMMREATGRMRDQISRLVELGSAGTRGEIAERLDLDAEVREVLKLHEVFVKDRGVQLKVKIDARRVVAARHDIRQLFDVFLANALRHGGAAPRVHVSAVSAPHGMVTVGVDDNGFCPPSSGGSPSAEILEQLSKRDRTFCVGLTIARRIAESYGGRVWAERSSLGGAALRATIGTTATLAPERQLLGEEVQVSSVSCVRPAAATKHELRPGDAI